MSRFLASVGRASARFRWIVLGAWVVVFGILCAVLGVGMANGSTDAAEQSMPDSPAISALERMQDEFPSSDSAGQSLQIVFAPTSGDVTDETTASAIAAVLGDARALPGVAAVSDPLDPSSPMISSDREIAVSTVGYGELTEEQQVEYYDAALALQENPPAPLGVELGGNLVPLGAPPMGAGEGVGVIVALIVLALSFGSLLAAGVNLLIAALGVGIGLVGVLAYGTLQPIGDNSIILAAMLGLAVGIDYSLFIISRYRSEVRSGRPTQEAIARATGTAGTAVVFAGSTVIVALVALLVANITAVTEMGMAAAFAVLTAVLLALTLLPAALSFMGLRVMSRRQREAVERGEFIEEGAPRKRGLLRGWGAVVTKHPVLSLLAGVATLVIVALPMMSMKTASMVPGGSDPESTERAAYDLVLDGFGGMQSPIIVLAEGDDVQQSTSRIEARLADLDHVQQVIPAQISDDGSMAQIVLIPEGSPIDEGTKDLVHTIRESADDVPGAHLEVTGEVAIGLDQDQQLLEALVRYVIVIVVISLLLMIVLFRSLLVPVIATLGYLLSVGAAFGASVAVFQWGWLDALIPAPQGDPMLSLLPIILVGVLFGLAMDYQVFMVSRIQEMVRKGLPTKEAIREGFGRSAPVLAAAATIMVVVFAGFATSHFAIGASIAFGLLVGVAADAFVVRMILMPAALSLLGRSAWWMPRWMERIVPDVDVEGHALDDTSEECSEARDERAPVTA